jgi:hypothetical protein
MRRLLALPLLALSLAACSDGVHPAALAPATTAPASSAPATSAPVVTETPAPEATPSAKPAPRTYDSKHFFTPSGGISCSVSDIGAVCEAKDHTWDLPPKPKDCYLDWGGMVEVRRTEKAELACAGDTGFGVPPEPVLAYGDSITMGDFRCTSARTGVTCANTETKHGFQVSRSSYRLY